jgi:Protein of unknown function (DUF1501)
MVQELISMLTLCDPRRGLSRRAFLQVGALGLGGLCLPGVLRARTEGVGSAGLVKDRSVIFLFLHGGPSQIETFDPKMNAPEGIRSLTGEVATRIPGVTFGSTFPRLAGLADRLTIVRSYQAGDGIHDIKPVVHRDALGANLGSLYARVAGMNHPDTGMVRNAALFPRAVDPEARPAQTAFGNFLATGPLGAAYTPFDPGGGGPLLANMRLNVAADRLEDRRRLLAQLDALRREVDLSGTAEAMDRFQQQAFDTILHGVGTAFDLRREDQRVVDRYDTAPLVSPDAVSRRNNRPYYLDNVRTLGKLLLLARRLCEAGCGFVTVTTNFVWDMHADGNNAPVAEAMPFVGGPLDHALSAFLEDVRARGLEEKILLVVTGEMGRTPRVNRNGGRDHWGNLTPLLLHGGGLRMGQVIGRSSRDAATPASEPLTRRHLLATILHTLLDPTQVRLRRDIPGDVARVITEGEPISGLVG